MVFIFSSNLRIPRGIKELGTQFTFQLDLKEPIMKMIGEKLQKNPTLTLSIPKLLEEKSKHRL